LIILPPEMTHARAGDEATVQLLDDSLQMTAQPGYPQP